MAYKIIKMLTSVNPAGARPGIQMKKIDGITIHMTDNWGNKANAIAHGNYLRNGGSIRQASWHYCVDDTCVTQSIPDDEIALHCGNTLGNNTTIGIEICLNPESNLKKACDNAAHLTAMLLVKHKIPISKLYRHYDWSGKWCPSEMMDGNPYTWDEFVNKVKANMKNLGNVTIEHNKDKVDTSAGIIGIGSTVTFDGKSCCYSASNGGKAGVIPPAGEYEVTFYNPGSLYSIHIGTYGWVPAANCGLVKLNDNEIKNPSKKIKVGSTVEFNGECHCYATSEGKGKGIIPLVGKYIVTHYNPGSKYPIHIDSYGWVSEESCGLKNHIAKIKVGSTVIFDGSVRCHSSSTGGVAGVIPPHGKYQVTYYSEGTRYAVHIGTYGWVPEIHCKLV